MAGNVEDPLLILAEEIVDRHGDIDGDLKKKLVADLIKSEERFVNAELLARLSEKGAREFVDFMQNGPSYDETTEFLSKKGIDFKDAVTTGLIKFTQSYYGKN